MKTKTLYILLVVFAAVCAVLGAMPGIAEEAFTSVIAFPLEQTALILRWLSLSGSAGNTAAIVIYVIVCLLPAAVMLFWMRKHGFHGEDSLIFILSAVLFAVVYFMINPALLMESYGADFGVVLRAILGGVCWSIVISWAVLRLLRRSAEAERGQVQRNLRVVLILLAFVFTAVAFGGGVSGFVDSAEALKAGNTAQWVDLSTSYIFLALQALVNALPYVLDAVVAVKGARLLGAMDLDRYSAETVEQAEKLSSFSVLSLRVTVIVSLLFNLLQLVSIKRLYVVNMSVTLPLVSIAFMLAVVLLSRLVRENKALKDDNDLFI